VTPRTTKEIAKTGVDNSRTEFCIARKLATGHASVLNDSAAVEYLFNPSFIEIRKPQPPDLKYCIYTSPGVCAEDVLSLDKSKQINPILHFGEVEILIRAFKQEFDRVGFNFTRNQIKEAIQYAEEAEEQFLEELYQEGDKFLERIEKSNEKA
jgi:predicted nucleotide-binding protein (sugar kinase/HSP70/actin superfamily)